MAERIVIVGGVAGGATAAARLRRLDENAEIVIIERGEYISFANCGLPYYIGDVIKERDRLVLQTPASFGGRFNIEVRTRTEAVRIDRKNRTLIVKDLKSGVENEEKYDHLILSPGAMPIKPPLAGIDDERIFTLRTIPDSDRIKSYIDEKKPKKALVIGAGFIGLEMAENLHQRGISVTIIEKMDQVMPPVDSDIANIIAQHARMKGVEIILGTGIAGFEKGERLIAKLENGDTHECDMAVLAIGVRPDTKIAVDAGLEVHQNGAIKVDKKMRTTDERIFAIGDAVQVDNPIAGTKWGVALAGPANRQARIVANVINGIEDEYVGTIGTSVVQVFDLTLASTGCSEKYLKQNGIKFEKVYAHPQNHVGYYPGAVPMSAKLIFDPSGGKILGAQIVGGAGVDKRIDVLATAIGAGLTAPKLKELELTYAPPYGAAKDPVNMLGFIAENVMEGKSDLIHWHEVDTAKKDSFLLDVRTTHEFEMGTIEGSVNIPIDSLRARISELPKEKNIIVFCQAGFRGYIAERILKQKGFKVKNLSGGYLTYMQALKKNGGSGPVKNHEAGDVSGGNDLVIDACGLACPGPIKKVFEAISKLNEGDVLRVTATDAGFANDIGAWCNSTGNTLLSITAEKGSYSARIKKGPAHMETKKECVSKDEKTIILFSGDLDKAMAAFIIATGAASMGKKVNIFFTFWGLNALRKDGGAKVKKDILSKMFGAMMPKGAKKMKLGKLNMGGIGTKLMKHIMGKKNVESLPQLITGARELGVKLIACQMTMDVMGLQKEELLDGIEIGGVATFLEDSDRSSSTIFI